MREAVAAFTTLGVAFISASVAYQFVKPNSQGVALASSVGGTVTTLGKTLYS